MDAGRTIVEQQQPSVNGSPVQAPRITDPMDLDAIRVDIGVPTNSGVVRAQVSVRKPPKDEWVRVHPSPEYQIAVTLLEDRSEGGFGGSFFVVNPDMREILDGEYDTVQIYSYVNTLGVPALWPIKLPKPGRDMFPATESQLNLAKLGQGQWIRVLWNGKAYESKVPIDPDSLPQPIWPRESLSELFGLAFGARTIKTVEHPIVLRLTGRRARGDEA
jgi:hypothetical protein